VIAEDLGVITPPVHALRDELGLPGMAVLQWGFGGDPGGTHVLANHRENQVVYTGTHDNDTIVAWWAQRRAAERRRVLDELGRAGIDEDEPHWALIRLAFSSRARVAVVPVQDVLGLGNEGRMNRPGTSKGNWSWRLEPGALTDELADRLRRATEAAGRL
jgi:4-alpha-glucanotransferase